MPIRTYREDLVPFSTSHSHATVAIGTIPQRCLLYIGGLVPWNTNHSYIV